MYVDVFQDSTGITNLLTCSRDVNEFVSSSRTIATVYSGYNGSRGFDNEEPKRRIGSAQNAVGNLILETIHKSLMVEMECHTDITGSTVYFGNGGGGSIYSDNGRSAGNGGKGSRRWRFG